jgi:hypothetical protein
MTTVATQQPDAVDGVNGGTYNANISFTGTHTHSNVLTLVSTDFTYVQPMHAAEPNRHTQNWWEIQVHGTYGYCWELLNVGAAYDLVIPLTFLPNQGELKSVTCYIDGGDAKGVVPGSYPILTVYERPISTGVEASLATVTDNPGGLAAYKLYHALGQGALSIPAGNDIDGTTEYYAVVTGDTGGGAAANDFWVVALVVTVTCTSIAPG